jgi:hypothetical protein
MRLGRVTEPMVSGVKGCVGFWEAIQETGYRLQVTGEGLQVKGRARGHKKRGFARNEASLRSAKIWGRAELWFASVGTLLPEVPLGNANPLLHPGE